MIVQFVGRKWPFVLEKNKSSKLGATLTFTSFKYLIKKMGYLSEPHKGNRLFLLPIGLWCWNRRHIIQESHEKRPGGSKDPYPGEIHRFFNKMIISFFLAEKALCGSIIKDTQKTKGQEVKKRVLFHHIFLNFRKGRCQYCTKEGFTITYQRKKCFQYSECLKKPKILKPLLH